MRMLAAAEAMGLGGLHERATEQWASIEVRLKQVFEKLNLRESYGSMFDAFTSHNFSYGLATIVTCMFIGLMWNSEIFQHVELETRNSLASENQEMDVCGKLSPHWPKIRSHFYRAAERERMPVLLYPGNEPPPSAALLRGDAFGIYPQGDEEPDWGGRSLPAPPTPHFVYLVQGPGGLPRHLKSLCSDNSTVLMLSYKRIRPDTIFVPNSTWTEGRNILFSAALHLEQLQGWRFLYYMFVDDDVEVTAGTWREFESECLVRHLPAMAAPYMHPYAMARGRRADQASVKQKSHEELEEEWRQKRDRGRAMDTDDDDDHDKAPSSLVTTAYFFDACVNAYHREAAVQLLPYSTSWDNSSWWISHFIQTHRATILYHGHVLMYHGLRMANPAHRQYQRTLKKLTPAQTAFIRAAQAYNNSAVGTCFRRWGPASAGQPFGPVENKTSSYSMVDYENCTPCRGPLYDSVCFRKKCREASAERVV